MSNFTARSLVGDPTCRRLRRIAWSVALAVVAFGCSKDSGEELTRTDGGVDELRSEACGPLVSNPSFESGVTGYEALSGTELHSVPGTLAQTRALAALTTTESGGVRVRIDASCVRRPDRTFPPLAVRFEMEDLGVFRGDYDEPSRVTLYASSRGAPRRPVVDVILDESAETYGGVVESAMVSGTTVLELVIRGTGRAFRLTSFDVSVVEPATSPRVLTSNESLADGFFGFSMQGAQRPALVPTAVGGYAVIGAGSALCVPRPADSRAPRHRFTVESFGAPEAIVRLVAERADGTRDTVECPAGEAGSTSNRACVSNPPDLGVVRFCVEADPAAAVTSIHVEEDCGEDGAECPDGPAGPIGPRYDIGVYNPFGTDGNFWIRYGDSGFDDQTVWHWHPFDDVQIVTGDFDGDGLWDVGMYNPLSDGRFWIQYGDGEGNFGRYTYFQWASFPGAQAFTGDFDADGLWDIGLYNPSYDGKFYIALGDGTGQFGSRHFIAHAASHPEAKVYAGDFDGDGFWDIGLYDVRHDGNFYISYGDGVGGFSRLTTFFWGHFPTGQVFTGDFDGDRLWDIGLYNPLGDGQFFIRYGDGSGSFERWTAHRWTASGRVFSGDFRSARVR